MNPMDLKEFLYELNKKSGGKDFVSKKWSNYPDSIFFYRKDDIDFKDEIGIYTNRTTYGIYI